MSTTTPQYTQRDLDAALFAQEVASCQHRLGLSEDAAIGEAIGYGDETIAQGRARLAAGRAISATALPVSSERAVAGTAGETLARAALIDRHPHLVSPIYRISAGWIAGSPATRWIALAARAREAIR